MKSKAIRSRKSGKGEEKDKIWTRMFSVFWQKMPHVPCEHNIPRIKPQKKYSNMPEYNDYCYPLSLDQHGHEQKYSHN